MKAQLQIPYIGSMRMAMYLVLLCVISIGCGSAQKMPPEMPKDFGFILQYGVDGKNVLNTFDQSYTKDLIDNGTIKTKLTFNEAELKMVHDTMVSIQIMSFPKWLQRDIVWHEKKNTDSTIEYWGESGPGPSKENYFVRLQLRMNGNEHEIFYRPDNCDDSVRCRDFDFLIRLIEQTLERKKEYRDLPKAEGGYM